MGRRLRPCHRLGRGRGPGAGRRGRRVRGVVRQRARERRRRIIGRPAESRRPRSVLERRGHRGTVGRLIRSRDPVRHRRGRRRAGLGARRRARCLGVRLDGRGTVDPSRPPMVGPSRRQRTAVPSCSTLRVSRLPVMRSSSSSSRTATARACACGSSPRARRTPRRGRDHPGRRRSRGGVPRRRAGGARCGPRVEGRHG